MKTVILMTDAVKATYDPERKTYITALALEDDAEVIVHESIIENEGESARIYVTIKQTFLNTEEE